MFFFLTAIPEVVRIKPQVFDDSRGFFLETYRAERMAAVGIPDRGSKAAFFSARLQEVWANFRFAPAGMVVRAPLGDGNRID